MATKKTTGAAVDATIISEETVTTDDKVAAAKKANAKVKEAGKAAVKKNAEATAAVVKDTAEKAVEKTKDVAEKTKAAAKKTAAKTRKAVKEAAEAAPKRKYTRKPVKNVVLQYMGQEISEEELTERALAQFAATEETVAVKSITLYIKPEDNAAYYVINEQYTGCVKF